MGTDFCSKLEQDSAQTTIKSSTYLLLPWIHHQYQLLSLISYTFILEPSQEITSMAESLHCSSDTTTLLNSYGKKVKSLSRVWLFATPMDCSLPGFSVHGILQARVLERVAISFSSGSSWPRDPTQVSCIVGRCFYCLSHQGSQRLPLNGYTPIQHKKLKV